MAMAGIQLRKVCKRISVHGSSALARGSSANRDGSSETG